MDDNFIRMLTMQQHTVGFLEDGDPTTFQNDEHRIRYIRDQFEAMIHELVEAKNECGWKPWGQNRDIQPEAMARELIDAWCFFQNWLLAIRPLLSLETNEQLAEWFAEAHHAKCLVNIERFTSGTYDGFAEKCKECGREQEASVWEEAPIRDVETDIVLVEHYLVCPCGNVLESKITDERGNPSG